MNEKNNKIKLGREKEKKRFQLKLNLNYESFDEKD